MTGRWRRWCIAAVEAGAGVGFVDAGLAMGWHGEWLPSRGARFVFALTLASVLALVLGVVVTAVAWVVDRIASLEPRWRNGIAQGLVIAFGLIAGFGLFSGTAMRHSPARPWAILATAALFAWLSQLLVPRWAAIATRVDRWPGWSAFALLGTSALLYIAHALVFVRLYPVLHALAAVGSLTALVASLALGIEAVGRARIAALAGVICLAGIAGGAVLMRSSERRALARERAPIASYVVRALGAATHTRGRAAIHDDRASHGDALDFGDADIVLVTVDALRADRLGVYGGPSQLTPAIDALAGAGVVVDRAYCSTPHTSYSLASLMTGKFFREVSALGLPVQPHDTLAGLLGRAGYRTAAFYPPAIWQVDSERLGDLHARGFDFADRFESWDDAATRVARVSRWLRDVPPTRRAFVWVHLFEPHEPYESHPNSRASAGPLARYDAEVGAVDDAIATLRRAVEQRGRRVVWVITADHGEEFGEHGGRFHGTTVYEEQVRVPFVVVAPGLAPRRIDGPISLVDVMPTLLAGARIPRPARLRGRDLGPELRGASTDAAVYAGAGSMRMIAHGHERLLCDVSEGSCAWFDLESDPAERVNRADAMATRVRTMREWLVGWEGSHARFDAERGTAPSEEIPEPVVRVIQGDRSAAADAAAMLTQLQGASLQQALRALADLDVRDATIRNAIAPLANRDVEAAVALAMLGDARGAQAARRALASDRSDVARRAALGLAHLNHHDGVRVLAAWVTERSVPDADRDRAVGALLALRDPAAFDAWIALLDDPRLAPIAARALGELGDRRAIDALAHTYASVRYPTTREAARVALGALDAGSAIDAAASSPVDDADARTE